AALDVALEDLEVLRLDELRAERLHVGERLRELAQRHVEVLRALLGRHLRDGRRVGGLGLRRVVARERRSGRDERRRRYAGAKTRHVWIPPRAKLLLSTGPGVQSRTDVTWSTPRQSSATRSRLS